MPRELVTGRWPLRQALNRPPTRPTTRHRLTADDTAGGHVLECRPMHGQIELAELPEITLRLPQTASFRGASLGQDRPGELRAVERTTTRPGR